MPYFTLKIDEFPVSSSNATPRVYSLIVPAMGRNQGLPIPIQNNFNEFIVNFTYSLPTIYVARNEAVDLDLSIDNCMPVNCLFNPTTRRFATGDVLHFFNAHETENVRVTYEIYFGDR